MALYNLLYGGFQERWKRTRISRSGRSEHAYAFRQGTDARKGSLMARKTATIGAVLLAALVTTSPGNAADRSVSSGVKIGLLTCNVEAGWGYILGSSKDIRCTFVPDRANGASERYRGHVTKVGVDIGYTKGGTLVWRVVAPTSDLAPGALQGNYAGLTAGFALFGGLGANALVGGFEKSIALSPLSIEGTTGLNVAAGIGAMELTHDRT
jgi:hypothetical protein